MSETLKIDLPERVADAISDAAKASGVSTETFIVEAAAAKALDLLDARAFFADRAAGGNVDSLLRILRREGGQPPRSGDERS